ncbi:Histone-lysine N-methyltransferase SETMAR [Habropoda laboriosa]|uniref:Histone-lysine N-methyltransferase SETMAR n=1 Tax=Habropoda laboriosa TaxID=597456 RepID=A0A0L7RFM6_9HYME|nr:Histone-lysine N-methyltransferase SETMAR [Habropoda laboriosa]
MSRIERTANLKIIPCESKERELQWELNPRRGYFLDLVPTDFPIFPSPQNSLDGEKFDNLKTAKNAISSSLNDKSQDFYERSITQNFHMEEKCRK